MAESKEIINAVFESWAADLDGTIESLASQIMSGQYGVVPDSSNLAEAEGRLSVLIRRELTSMMFGYCVTIDGGSDSADTGMVYLIDENGTDHTRLGLHGAFLAYLDDTGRSTV
ncbi:hypothetical protein [Planotetraspora kaengkrachanensis]|uniref:Uncharacterized protein n=1 Tax=Planotetraspora kaengkrachanensis TaxID=575193 RepID=A0A8J3Q1F1_9ACTN|nr:hypothetical protein [Planotetraspora kaengkrachanensis]GIG84975.1 hypothetical protein Pka01_81020 [Planotetraspora kaengkrachanensis]